MLACAASELNPYTIPGISSDAAQATLCLRLCLRRPGSHVRFLVLMLMLALMLVLASYV